MPHMLGNENVIFGGLDYSNEIQNPCDFHLSHADVCADCLAKENESFERDKLYYDFYGVAQLSYFV